MESAIEMKCNFKQSEHYLSLPETYDHVLIINIVWLEVGVLLFSMAGYILKSFY